MTQRDEIRFKKGTLVKVADNAGAAAWATMNTELDDELKLNYGDVLTVLEDAKVGSWVKAMSRLGIVYVAEFKLGDKL